jgi:hypothetical protein
MNNPSRWDQINELFEKYKDKYIVPTIIDAINPKSGLAEDIRFLIHSKDLNTLRDFSKSMLRIPGLNKILEEVKQNKLSIDNAYKKIKIKLNEIKR